MRAVNLSSGSDGNLTYIESDNAKILVDIGLSCKEVEKRLSLLNLTGKDIDAIFITHEHADHIKGLDVFASKFNTKIFAHASGWPAIDSKLTRVKQEQKWSFTSRPFVFKDLKITAFNLPHDSACCVGYSFESDNKKISILTDCGKLDNQILEIISASQLIYLESNHNIKMLKENPNYSPLLKRRILSNYGHLSNDACAAAIKYLVKTGVKQIVLSHLSRENNSPEIAYSDVTNYLKDFGIIEGVNIKIDVATTMPGKIFKIT